MPKVIHSTREKSRKRLTVFGSSAFLPSVNVNSEQGSSPEPGRRQGRCRRKTHRLTELSALLGRKMPESAAKVSLLQSAICSAAASISALSLETGKNATYAVEFVEPRLLDRDVALTLSTSLTTTRGLGQWFNTEQWRVAGSLSFPISETMRLNVGGGSVDLQDGECILQLIHYPQ